MESLLLPIINHISQSFPEIPYVDEDYGQLEAIDNDNIISTHNRKTIVRPSITPTQRL